MADSPEISAVICTHNRERYLERCIASLLAQSIPSSEYEIIIVDNGSTDSTKEICNQFAGRVNFRYLFEPVLGLSQARNTGWKAAQGKYVGYIDDDATAEPAWLENALRSFRSLSPSPEWVGGPVLLEWEAPSPAWLTEEYHGALGRIDWGASSHFLENAHEWLAGGNSFYRRDILQQLNGFDTRLGRKKNLLLSGEEVQFQHRLKAVGGRIYYHPGIRIHHFVPKERTQPSFFYRRYYWGGVTDCLMSKTLRGIPFEAVAQKTDSGSRAGRLFWNALRAAGFFVPTDQAVQSRIYFAYVLGWIVATVRHGRQKKEADSA